MTAPASLSGLASAITVDGIDLHSFGMVVLQITNTPPQARKSAVQIPGRDGDFDYSRNYETRQISLRGHIVGDSNSDLLTRVDALRSFFRLRENGDSFQVILQNQIDRYWSCKYEGGFDISAANWKVSRTATFSISLKCTKPFAEAVAATVVSAKQTIFSNLSINYAGTFPTPLNFIASSPLDENILESVAGAASEDSTLWTYSNATGSDITTSPFFGTNLIKATRTAAGTFYMQIDVSAEISDSKNYVFGFFVANVSSGVTNHISLSAVTNGAVSTKTVLCSTGEHFVFLKLSAAELAGATSVLFNISNDGADSWMTIDGCFIYEITAAEFADAAYFPPPYISDAAGDDKRETVNAKLRIYNGKNLLQYSHGDDKTDWYSEFGNTRVISDPLDQDKKCVSMWSTAASGSLIRSPFVVLDPKSLYQLQFKYFVLQFPAGASGTLKFKGTVEYDTGFVYSNMNSYGSVTLSAVSTAWTTVQAKVTAFNFQTLWALVMQASKDVVVLVKEIQIIPAAAAGDPYADYEKHKSSFIQWNNTMAANDKLVINSETLTVQLADYSAEDIINGMGDFVGEKGLVLVPGQNYLKFSDNRSTIAAKEQGAGSANLLITYRNRYL